MVDVADAEPVLEQIDGVNRTGGSQRHVRHSLHLMRAGLRDLLERKKIKTDDEGYVCLRDLVSAMRSAHSCAISIQYAVELATQHDCFHFKAVSDKTFIKE